jgi:beta-lactamase superfamily II metal-dependent hydrolase
LIVEPTLYILDVGHGNSSVLVDDRVIVVDAGPGNALLEFMQSREIIAISVVLISHADEDHIKGLISLVESGTVSIETIHVNSNSIQQSETWKDLAFILDLENSAKRIKFEVGLTTNHSNSFSTESITIEILAPSPGLAIKGPGSDDHKGRKLTSNSVSAVVRLLRGQNPLVLLPGDLDETGLENLTESGRDIRAMTVVFPHHGGVSGYHDASKFAQRFFDACKPESVIFSIGRGKYGTPRPEIVAAAYAYNAKIRILCTQLSERCANTVPKTDPKHLTKFFSKGREAHKCCAGTIVLALYADGPRLQPQAEDHLRFIAESAPTALCSKPE